MDRGKLKALYQDGMTARPHAVSLQMQDTTLLIIDGQGAIIARWDAYAVFVPTRQTDLYLLRFGLVPMHIVGPNSGERLLIKDASVADAIRTWIAPIYTHKTSLLRRHWLAVAVAVWIVLGICVLGVYYSPKVLVHLIPLSVEKEWGASLSPAIADIYADAEAENTWCETPAGTRALASMVSRLQDAGDPSLSQALNSFNVRVLNSKISNAFALPGGQIIICSALLADMESPDMLAGIIAHEMGHATERHSMQSMVQQIGLSMLVTTFKGGRSGAIFAQLAVGTRFSRENERKADSLGVVRAARAGFDAATLADFFTNMEREDTSGSLFSYISTHPEDAERIKNIQQQAQEQDAVAAFLLPENEWQSLQNICLQKQLPERPKPGIPKRPQLEIPERSKSDPPRRPKPGIPKRPQPISGTTHTQP